MQLFIALIALFNFLFLSITAAKAASEETDLYLEQVVGPDALAWVQKQNQRTRDRLELDPRFAQLKQTFLSLLNAPDRLLSVSLYKKEIHNLWRDENHRRGIYRKCSIKSYASGQPEWVTLLDLDQLALQENEDWNLKRTLKFGDRALILLSRGGRDATVMREFDLTRGQFVSNGFTLPEGKHDVQWLNPDTLIVGAGHLRNELTESGYTRILRMWRRGTEFESAPIVFSGAESDVSSSVSVFRDEPEGPATELIGCRSQDFFHKACSVLRPVGSSHFPVPGDADWDISRGWVYMYLRTNWSYMGRDFQSGSLVRIRVADLLSKTGSAELLFKSSTQQILSQFVILNNRIFVGLSENVNVRWSELQPDAGKRWRQLPLQLPQNSNIQLISTSEESQQMIFSSSGFLQPPAQYLVDIETRSATLLAQSKEAFDASDLEVRQHFATSPDGTKVPYYLVAKRNLTPDGQTPTLLYAYGGFEVSLRPWYSAGIGATWLSQGGAFVVANIRGGGEFGPEWHRAALKRNRQRAYDDFHAVAQDLIDRGITSPSRLGIYGESNGGLLMGVAFTQRPDLYQAVSLQVPLLDMLRFHQLLAGPSWVGEYGNPEVPEDRAALTRYSPYHNVHANQRYPEVFFMTSTADDRVHPGHARRMAARMERLGLPFLFYENSQYGHGGTTDNEQVATWRALQYVYFMQKLNFTESRK